MLICFFLLAAKPSFLWRMLDAERELEYGTAVRPAEKFPKVCREDVE
jgi:hypothetical protein